MVALITEAMGCKGSKAQATQPQVPTDSKAETGAEVETTVPETDVDAVSPVGDFTSPPKIDDAAAPENCTFCCA